MMCEEVTDGDQELKHRHALEPAQSALAIRCPVGETRVDLQHLLEDLRDAYTGALEETILTEVVANALDSGAAVPSPHQPG